MSESESQTFQTKYSAQSITEGAARDSRLPAYDPKEIYCKTYLDSDNNLHFKPHT